MTSRKQIFFHPERCLLCLSCVLACQTKDTGFTGEVLKKKVPHSIEKLKVTFAHGTPWVWKCQQCQNPPCTEACFTGGLQLEKDSRNVVQDIDACVGCGSCLLACPIEGIRLLPGEQRPGKCDACRGNKIPACVKACDCRALVFVENERFAGEKRKRFVQKLTGKK